MSKHAYKITTRQLVGFDGPVLVTPGNQTLFNYTSICKYLLDDIDADSSWSEQVSTSSAKSVFRGVGVNEQDRKEAESQLDKLTSIQHMRKVKPTILQYKTTNEVKLPQAGKKNVLITSALPYVNNVPHLGNIIGCVLSADVFARWSRQSGHNVLYVCGTDEYGTATEVKALQEGVTCIELCDKYHQLHKQIYDQFDIEFDHFGRTTTPKHTEISQAIFAKINDNRLFVKDQMPQLWCEQDQRYLSDRYVAGECPLCQYPDARGDQCDGCGKLLNATDLVNAKCKLCATPPIERMSQHLFLNLPDLQERIQKFCNDATTVGQWTKNGADITQAWLKDPLKNRCITRDLKWGTQVPLDGYRDKVLYVWFDAPIGYISITANYTKDYLKWWQPDAGVDVKLYQFMGKDNVPFHSVIFPGVLMGTGDRWTMLHHLNTTDYLNYEGDKFSKSRNVGVFGDQVQSSGIDMSVYRYYLLSVRPETGDSTFTWQELQAKSNAELLGNFGNYINRTLKFVQAKYASQLPQGDASAEAEQSVIKQVDNLIQQFNAYMEYGRLRAAVKCLTDISAVGNVYLQESKLDNSLMLNDRKKADTVLSLAVNLIYTLSAMAGPFMPAVATQILAQLNAPAQMMPQRFEWDALEVGHRIGKPQPLFQRIDDATVRKLQAQYGGVTAQAKAAALVGADGKKVSKRQQLKQRKASGDGKTGTSQVDNAGTVAAEGDKTAIDKLKI